MSFTSIQSFNTMESYVLSDKKRFNIDERSLTWDNYRYQSETPDSDSAISSEEEQFTTTCNLENFQKNTIVKCLQKAVYGNDGFSSTFRQLNLACSDHSCVFKVNPDALNSLIWGNFIEENGLTIDVKDNYVELDQKENNKKPNKNELETFGVIGDRGSGNYLKISLKEKNIVETETLARITWDVSKRCTNHKEPLYFVCEQCERTICSKCSIENHQGHRLVSKYTESAFTTAKKIHLSLNNYIKDIENLLFQIEIILKEIPQKAKETAESVLDLLNSWEYHGSCSHRKPYLLKLIETIKSIKIKDLKLQQYNLNQLLFRMESNLKSLKQSFLTENAKVVNYASLSCREDLNLARIYDYGFIPIHNKEFRIAIKPNVIKKPAGLIVIGTKIVESMRKIALKKIAFEDSERYFKNYKIDFFNNFKVNISKENQISKETWYFSEEGNKNGQVCRPWGIACDENGRFFISDRSNNRIQVFNRQGKFEFSFGSFGNLKGQLNRPAGITIDLNRLIVADKDNHRIQIFTLNGEYILDFGKLGNKPGNFNYPWDVCTNPQNELIAVSDTKNRRVQLFTKNGILNGIVDFYPYDLKFFDLPRAVRFNPKGELVVGDFNNHRFIIFDQVFSSFRLHGSEGQFNRPQGLAIDSDGNHIVADSKNCRVIIFDRNFKMIKEIKSELFKNPQGVCLTPTGNIAVIDMEYNRIVVL